MHFVSDNENQKSEQNQMWMFIQDEHSHLICRKHSLKVMLAAIMGFSSKWMFTAYLEQQANLKVESRRVEITKDKRKLHVEIGTFVESMYFLKNEEEGTYLHKLFHSFDNT